MELFAPIALIFSTAALLGWVAHRWRQPLILAYLVAGFLLASSGQFRIEDQIIFTGFAEIGVSLLLFLVGLKLSLRDLRLVGLDAVRLGVGQIMITFLLIWIVAWPLGFGFLETIFLGLALTLSSTIIVVKLLTEKRELVSLHGKLTVGLLLVQDLVVLLVMVGLTGFQLTSGVSIVGILALLGKITILFLITAWLAKKPVPWLFTQLAGSTELLFIAAIGWCFTATAVAQALGFTPEIGAFLAGVGLANTTVGVEIAAKVKSLRDFFLGIFFILLGVEMGASLTTVSWFYVLLFTPMVLIVKPLVVWFILIWMGYRQRTAFFSAIVLGQISEFSLILIRMGQEMKLLAPNLVGTVVVIGVLSIGLSASLTHWAERLYHRLRPCLWPPHRPVKEEIYTPDEILQNHLVLLGCDRSGQTILPILLKMDLPLIVVDFNPSVVARLTAEKVKTLYGDVGDEEILDQLNLTKAKLVVSTVNNWQDNLLLLSRLSGQEKPLLILTATSQTEAIEFYNRGADYVIVPEIAGGEHLGSLLTHHRLAKADWTKIGKRHYQRLMASIKRRIIYQ